MTETPTVSPASRGPLARKFIELGKLSWPIVVSRVGFLLLSVVDTILVGHYATDALAAISITHAVADTYMLIAAGMLMGILVVASISMGKSEPREAGLALRRGVRYSLGLGVGASLLALATLPLLTAFGVQAKLASQVSELMMIVVFGLVPMLIYIAYSFFLEGISKPLPATWVMLAGNLVNAALAYGLIYGKLGLPELGAAGSAWATTIVRVLLGAALCYYVHRLMPERDTYGVNAPFKWSWSGWEMQRQIGYGGGLSFGIEAGAFMLLALMAGAVSPVTAAACAILVNIRSTLFMVPMGVGFATSIQVGMGYGQQDLAEINRSTWAGIVLGVGATAAASVFVGLWPQPLLSLYSDDEALVAIAAGVMGLLAVTLLLDAWQAVMSNALRGREDALAPTLLQGIAYLLVMIPLCWFLMLYQQRGLAGLVESLLVGNLLASVLMTMRHWHLNGRARLVPVAA